MLAVQQTKNYQGKCVPNVLPCRINHNGPINASKRYWAPTEAGDGKAVSYFRGRKLHGRRVKLPEGYRGVLLSSTDETLPKGSLPKDDTDDVEEEQLVEEVGIMEETAEFEEVMVWGHEVLPDDAADPYVRGVEEWIAFAQRAHSYTPKEDESISAPK